MSIMQGDMDTKYNLWIGNQANPEDRLKVRVSDADRAKVAKMPRSQAARVQVVNLDNGEILTLRRASCGLPRCLCAVTLVEQR